MSDNRYINTDESKQPFGNENVNQKESLEEDTLDLSGLNIPFNETSEQKQERLKKEKAERDKIYMMISAFVGRLQGAGVALEFAANWDRYSKELRDQINGILEEEDLKDIEKHREVYHSREYGEEDESPFDKRD